MKTGSAIGIFIATIALILYPEQVNSQPIPPIEVLTACKEFSVGTKCDFQLAPKTVGGTCQTIPGGVLACVPTKMPPLMTKNGQPPKPPREAVTACANIATGDKCAMHVSPPKMSGVCKKIADGNIACVPPFHKPL